jgi:hypothetical protein
MGDMQCIDLGNDYFLIRFKMEEDYWKVVNGGPWFINQQFLTLRRWSPGFRPSEAKISTTAVWARLPELLIELYDMNILRRIGNQLGSLLKVDARTMDNERGRYARLCVQIDLEQPLIPRIRIGNLIQKIQYEGISAICFECGRVGHRLEACPSKIAPASPMSPKTPENTHPPSFEQDSSNFGKWMIVSRRKSVAKKAIQKNTNTLPKSPVTSNASKHRNSKPINSTSRDPPLEPHKAPMSSSPIPIGKDKRDPMKSGRKSDQSGSSKQPSSSLNTQTVNHHSVSIDSAHLEKSNTTLLSSTENNTLNTRFIPSHDSVNCHHVSQTSDHTSNHPLKVNLHLPTDQVPNSPLITTFTNSNPLTSMDINASKLIPSSEPHSNSHIPNTPCPTTHSAHGSTSSGLSPESPKHTKQTSLPQQKPPQKPECPQSTQPHHQP